MDEKVIKDFETLRDHFPEMDASSRDIILEWEKQLALLISESEYASHDFTKKTVLDKKQSVMDIEKKLSSDRTLSEKDREYLFAKKAVLEEDISRLGRDFNKEIAELKERIAYEAEVY